MASPETVELCPCLLWHSRGQFRPVKETLADPPCTRTHPPQSWPSVTLVRVLPWYAHFRQLCTTKWAKLRTAASLLYSVARLSASVLWLFGSRIMASAPEQKVGIYHNWWYVWKSTEQIMVQQSSSRHTIRVCRSCAWWPVIMITQRKMHGWLLHIFIVHVNGWLGIFNSVLCL